MDLQEQLDKSGYTQALEKLDAANGMLDIVVRDIDSLPNKASIPQLRIELAAIVAKGTAAYIANEVLVLLGSKSIMIETEVP